MEFSFQQIVMNVDIKPGEKGEGSISSKNVRRRERKEIVETNSQDPLHLIRFPITLRHDVLRKILLRHTLL